MPTMQQLEKALIAADQAGDTQAAIALTNEIKALHKQQQAPSQEQGGYTGTFLPFKKDAQGNISPAVPGIISGLFEMGKSAATLPGDVYSGKVPFYGSDGDVNPEVVRRSTESALLLAPGTPAMGTGKTISRIAVKDLPKKVPPGLGVAKAGRRIGVDVPRAATTDSTLAKGVARPLEDVPILGDPLVKGFNKAGEQLDDAAKGVIQKYGSGNPVIAGDTAKRGLVEFAGKDGKLAQHSDKLYGRVDSMVRNDAEKALTNTIKTVKSLQAKRDNSAISGESKAIKEVIDAANREGMNYEGIKNLRTHIGEMLQNKGALANTKTSESELKAIYGALTKDLEDIVAAAGGPQASRAFDVANRSHAKKAALRKSLEKLLGADGSASPEAIVKSIEGLAGSTGRADVRKLWNVKAALGRDGMNEVSSAILEKMWQSPTQFSTKWEKLSVPAKRALFGGKGNEAMYQALDDIATVSGRLKELNKLGNYSNSSRPQNLITLLGGATAGALVPAEALITGGAGAAGVYGMAKYFANPNTARAISRWTRAYEAHAVSGTPKSYNALLEASRQVAVGVLGSRRDKKAVQDITNKLSGTFRQAS